MKNFLFFTFLILIVSTNSQISLDFFIDDNLSYNEEEEVNAPRKNLRSSLEILTENEKEFKTVLKACLGTPPQCFNLGVQTNTFYIWVRSSNSREKNLKTKTFDLNNSTTLQRNNQYFQKRIFGRKVTGFEARDILTINGQDYSKIIIYIF